MNKKILLIFIIVIVIGLIVGGYFYWQSRKKEEPQKIVEGQISKIVMQFPKISTDEKWIYYYSTEQDPGFYRLELESGKIEKISDTLDGIEEIKYSDDTKKAGFRVTYQKDRFEQYGSPFLEPKMLDGDTRFWIYDFEKKGLNYLNQNIIEYVFSADGQKIIYYYRDPSGSGSINQMPVGQRDFQKIIDLEAQFIKLLTLNEKQIYVITTSDSEEGNGFYRLDLEAKKLELLTDKDFSSQANLSPQNKQLLFYSEASSGEKINSTIFTIDKGGKNRKDILKNSEIQFDFQNLAWSQDEKAIYVAGKEPDKEIYEAVYKLNLEKRELSKLLEKHDSNFQIVAIDQNGARLLYLLNSTLYASKI